MCNPNWTALECISTTYLIQVLLIFIGLILGFIGLITRDITSILVDQKPLLKIKGFEFNPQMPRKTRLSLKNTGIGLIALGLIWIIVVEVRSPLITRANSLLPISTAPSIAPSGQSKLANISLAGVSYIIGSWNPRQIDLLTASTEGISLDTQAEFKLVDMQVMVSDVNSAAPYQIQAKIFANGDKEIGGTKIVDLASGIIMLGDAIPTSFQHPTIENAWLPQNNWGKITLELNMINGDEQIVQSTKTDLLLADETSIMV